MGLIDVRGVRELQQLFAELAGPSADRALVKGVTAGAEVFQEAITALAPVRQPGPSKTALPVGKLKSSIRIRLKKLRNKKMAAFVEPSPDVRHVARFLEYGFDLVRGGTKSGGGRVIKHVEPKPFVRPAFDTSEDEAVRATADTITRELITEAKSRGLR